MGRDEPTLVVLEVVSSDGRKFLALIRYTCVLCSVQLISWLPAILQGNFTEADSLYERAATILETYHGPGHIAVSSVLKSRVAMTAKQVGRENATIHFDRGSGVFLGNRVCSYRPTHRRSP